MNIKKMKLIIISILTLFFISCINKKEINLNNYKWVGTWTSLMNKNTSGEIYANLPSPIPYGEFFEFELIIKYDKSSNIKKSIQIYQMFGMLETLSVKKKDRKPNVVYRLEPMDLENIEIDLSGCIPKSYFYERKNIVFECDINKSLNTINGVFWIGTPRPRLIEKAAFSIKNLE